MAITLLELFFLASILSAAAWGGVATAWVRRYNGPGKDYDKANAIAVDGQGNVYVTGTSCGSGTGNYATIKYSPSGQRLWVRRYNGPDDVKDEATAIAVDAQGNVYVTGYSYGGLATDYDYATIKYDTDGNRKWVRRYNSPGNDYDAAYAIAVDSQGNVYVTGFSFSSSVSVDFATIKYSPSGERLWVRRYNGQGNSSDKAFAIALDSQGNVYVAGSSTGWGTGMDYATIKYSSAGQTLVS
jgi:hypothetical protein